MLGRRDRVKYFKEKEDSEDEAQDLGNGSTETEATE